MSDTPPPRYRNPGWLAATVGATGLIVGVITNQAHVGGQTTENTRQIVLLWSRMNDVPKMYADVAAIKAHAEDTEKRLDQIDAKLDRALERTDR